MSGRTTPRKDSAPSVSSLRRRNPLMWWMAVILAVALVLSTMGSALLLFLSG